MHIRSFAYTLLISFLLGTFIPNTLGYGGGGGGGSLYHTECVNQQCIYVIGFGTNLCSTSGDCANQNMNGQNQNTNAQQNTNRNGQTTTNTNTNGTSSGNQNTNGYFFTDTANHWARDYIEKIHKSCNLNGYQDAEGNTINLYRPDDFITRAEIIAILIKCKKIEVQTPTNNPFPDVDRLAWYGSFIARAKALGWVSGYPDGTFRPMIYINRAEASKVLVLRNFTSSQIIGGIRTFIDTIFGSWYDKYVAFAVLKGYIDGYRDQDGNLTGLFGPGDNMTRAEAAKIIVNINGF